MITTILWDVDRTLLDFDAAERAAVQSLYIEFGLGECSEEAPLETTYWRTLPHSDSTI